MWLRWSASGFARVSRLQGGWSGGPFPTRPALASLSSTSTVADSYRWINRTVGNKTSVDEGYYYLNNFDNILNSFGELRNDRCVPAVCEQHRYLPWDLPWVFSWVGQGVLLEGELEGKS